MLNPKLDIPSLADAYRQDERLRIDNVLDPKIAQRVQEICLNSVPFDYVYHLNGENLISSQEEMSAMGKVHQQNLHNRVMQEASEGVGFLYCGYRMDRARDDADEALHFLHDIFLYLNSEDMLNFIRQVSGRDDIVSVDGQFTRYTPGQFLTRHSDNIEEEGRRLAYVFGFSQHWHPDWGGLLLFYENNGDARDFWIPAFNTLSLFDVRHVHSVSYVTPFAKHPRLSLTGWFRAK